ncbi:TetR/AcrR family transcriptional regulator [Glycomyces buryatensis]|uniref:TetR/AcrR family transcriptional regulator n=1 Tax=Glycomyces buryatensis TaxID=2570927 RepID=A0A4S8QDN4_9ACTN|nr:TetR/AcrR family transcriptional regulator [Glycomyces buryatensis]THV41202.1 TetR/AcrR family transcriptional regulator [Glycomyces buryatensis]
MTTDTEQPRLTRAARRVLDTASELFYHQGINSVGVDRIAAEAGVTKKTIYDRFGSKDNLVMAYLRARDVRWRVVVERHIDAAPDPRGAVLAVFDSLTEWRATEGDRGCAMINARAEISGPDHPAHALAADQKRWLMGRFAELIESAGLLEVGSETEVKAEVKAEIQDTALELLLLHEGAVVMSDVGQFGNAVAIARKAAGRLLSP